MIKKLQFFVPEYQEKREIFEMLGYEEIEYIEKGVKCTVTFRVEGSRRRRKELHKIEKLYMKKGPSYKPILLLAILSFLLISIFIVFYARSLFIVEPFSLLEKSLEFLLPAGLALGADIVYTILYFQIHEKLIQQKIPTKEELQELLKQIKN